MNTIDLSDVIEKLLDARELLEEAYDLNDRLEHLIDSATIIKELIDSKVVARAEEEYLKQVEKIKSYPPSINSLINPPSLDQILEERYHANDEK